MNTPVAIGGMVVIAILAGGAGFIGGGYYASGTLLAEVNDTGAGNFRTAVAVFRADYAGKRMVLFGEDARRETFTIGGYQFDVVPAAATQEGTSRNDFNGNLSNVAAHLNGMVVMLACKWMEDRNPAGEELLAELVDHMPNFRSSAPELKPVKVVDLKKSPEMMKSEAEQWEWRVEKDPK